jgi:single-strand DNA-binding protein
MPRNISEFRIIGQVGSVDAKEKVAYVNVAANYNRQVDGAWETDTHWNRVTCFGRSMEAAQKAEKGDMVHVTGRVRQTSYEREGATIYGVDLVAESFSVLHRAADGNSAED